MATFWERVHLVDHICSFCILTICNFSFFPVLVLRAMFGMGYVILLWHSLSLPYNYFGVLISPVSGQCLLVTFNDLIALMNLFLKKLPCLQFVLVEID